MPARCQPALLCRTLHLMDAQPKKTGKLQHSFENDAVVGNVWTAGSWLAGLLAWFHLRTNGQRKQAVLLARGTRQLPKGRKTFELYRKRSCKKGGVKCGVLIEPFQGSKFRGDSAVLLMRTGAAREYSTPNARPGQQRPGT